jgi:methylenetetrahydrofolate--tRNA-(uracil-5-)-methyltransferase
VPAGGAFAVDRDKFSALVTERLRAHPRIDVKCEIVETIPDGPIVVLATGPLTGDALAKDLARVVGSEHLAYYDAIAPVVTAESVDWSIAFKASRYDKGGDDAYGNCPLAREEYAAFIAAVLTAEKVVPRDFEDVRYFEGCLPIEVMAERGEKTLSFGCMKPVGLTDPRTGRWPHAVVQLRPENAELTAYNMVGFQTRMTWPEQKRVFRMIPGLANAEFERLGSVHRNTFVRSPDVLAEDLSLRARPNVFLAGQVTGVEGYIESAACGLVLGRRLAAKVAGRTLESPPTTTALGALLGHLRKPSDDFQPSNVVWAMFPEGDPKIRDKKKRRDGQVERALRDLDAWLGIANAARNAG